MKFRSLSVSALALSLAVTPALLASAQTTPAADASSNAASAAPTGPVTPAPATPAAPVAPVPTPADTTTAPAATPEERPTTYTMVAGDSLDSIAHKFDTSIHALAKLNKIPKSEFRKLRPGKVLQIPPAKPDAASTAK